MMHAVIDIGSNTMRMSVYQVSRENKITLMFNKKEFVGLAGYVDESNMLTRKGIEKTVIVLDEFKQILKSLRIRNVHAFATASLRNIENTRNAKDEIEKGSGLKIEVISGQDEALYDYIGATFHAAFSDGLLIDIGGGSTEIAYLEHSRVLEAVSYPFGSLNMFTRNVSGNFPRKNEAKAIRDTVLSYIKEMREPYLRQQTGPLICGVGGTIRAACKLNNDYFDFDRNNLTVSIKNIKRMLKFFEKESRESILKLVQIVPERSHTILPGMIVLQTIANYFGCNEIRVSEFGVREGYLISNILHLQEK